MNQDFRAPQGAEDLGDGSAEQDRLDIIPSRGYKQNLCLVACSRSSSPGGRMPMDNWRTRRLPPDMGLTNVWKGYSRSIESALRLLGWRSHPGTESRRGRRRGRDPRIRGVKHSAKAVAWLGRTLNSGLSWVKSWLPVPLSPPAVPYSTLTAPASARLPTSSKGIPMARSARPSLSKSARTLAVAHWPLAGVTLSTDGPTRELLPGQGRTTP
jgi:hypothetical protein